MSKINKLITLATIFILLVSNLGNSLQVIAETTKSSDTKPYEETSFVSEKTEENLIVESDQPKESEETENKKNEPNSEDVAENQTEDNSMSSIESISGVNRDSYAESWEIGEGVDSYGLREWVSGNLKSYIDSALRGKTLGGNVGDKIEGIISFPSQMKIEGLTASNWNNQNTIILGGANGYYYFKNIRFSHDESIKISLSGTDTDSSRKIVIERVAISTKSIMSIGVEYSFTSKGTVSSNVGVKPINPGGVGNSIQFTINANPSTSVSFNDLTSVEQADIKKRIVEVIGTQVWRNNIFRGSRNDLPTSLPSLGWEIGDFYVLDMGKTFSDISIDNGITIGGHISVINEPEVEYKDSAKGFMKHSYVDGQFRLERTKKGFINIQVVEWKNVKIESSDLLYVNTQSQKILVRLDEPIVLDTVQGYSGARGPEKFEVDVNNDLSINVGEKLDEEFIRENILKSAKLDNKEIPLEDVQIQSSSIDTSEPGKKTLTVTFKENNSKFVSSSWKQLEVEKNINVDIEDRVITADAVPTSIPLGTDTKKLNPKDFVTNVKLSGKTLKESEYTVEKLTGLTSTVISNEKIQFKISLTSNTAITTTIDVPVSVVWGNSIHLKGAYSSAVSTLSLVQGTDRTYMIKGVRGKNYDGSTSQSMVNPSFKDRYIGIDYLNVNGQIQNGSNMTSYYHTEIKGTDDLTGAWESVELSKEVNLGDVVKVEHREFMSYPSLVLLYTDSEESQPNKDKKMVNNTGYFEITENGFKQLNFNQLKNGKKFKIYMSDTKETLETKLKNNEFLTNEGYSSIEIVEFSTLPDTSKAGDTTGKIKVKEKLSNDKYVYYEYEVNFEVEDDRLVVDTKEADVFLGTDINLIAPSIFIDSVKLGDQKLTNNDYKVEYVTKFDTSIIGNPQVSLKITLNSDSKKFVEVTSKANVKYGSTIISRAYDTKDVDVSVSLLDNNGVPYLNANQGFGFSDYGGLLSRPNMSIYRESNYNQILSVGYGTVKNNPKKLAEIWNQSFDKVDLEYGDVVKYSVNNYGNNTNSKGKNTWISRNESLVRETEGYYEAYYELTTSGYRLMNINQLELNNSNKVSLNTSKEEMDKNILSYINIPSHISNPQDYRMEFQSVDTSSSGKKTTTIKVYQKLQSGGEFMTTYSVNYTVNPEIEETSYDVEGNKIVETKKTSFDYGTQFKPSPTKYLEKDDNLYVYKGWLENTEEPGVDVPKEGIPSPTEKESKFYYIYEKADKYINVTIPTEVVFGTFDNTEKVKSNKYEIKNNSKELTTSVTLDSFQSVSTSVKLLGENDELDEKIDSARLNLLINDEPKIKGFNETESDIELANIEPENKITIGINGEYYDKTSKTNIVEYNTTLKFKAISGN